MTVARLVRWGVPGAMVVAGVLVAIFVNEGVGEAIAIAAPCVSLGAWLIRLGFQDVRDRDDEEAAREFMDVHGHWPDEAPPPRS